MAGRQAEGARSQKPNRRGLLRPRDVSSSRKTRCSAHKPLYIQLTSVYNVHVPLSIRNSEVERLARSLARLTGEGLTQTILQALRERYQRVRAARHGERLMEDLTVIARRAAALPKHDQRSADEILGYDEHGLPR